MSRYEHDSFPSFHPQVRLQRTSRLVHAPHPHHGDSRKGLPQDPQRPFGEQLMDRLPKYLHTLWFEELQDLSLNKSKTEPSGSGLVYDDSTPIRIDEQGNGYNIFGKLVEPAFASLGNSNLGNSNENGKDLEHICFDGKETFTEGTGL